MPVVHAISTCAVCGGAFVAPSERCYACTTAIDAIAATRVAGHRGSAGDAATGAVLTVHDFAILQRIARLRPDDPIAATLIEKLDQSAVMAADAVTAGVVTLGSRVVFSADGGPWEARMLVLPTQHAATGWTLPVTAPRGLALLGRPAGAVVTVRRGDGSTEHLRILAVFWRREEAIEVPGSGGAPHPADRREPVSAGPITAPVARPNAAPMPPRHLGDPR